MTEIVPNEAGPAGLDLERLLGSIQRGGAHYPDSWDSVVTFSSRKPPHEIDARKFGEFQAALLERAGILLKLVGARYGCTDIFFEIIFPDPSKAEKTYGIRTNMMDPAEREATLVAVLQHDAHLRAMSVAAGLPTLRGRVNFDLSSNGVSKGSASELVFQVSNIRNIYKAPVGVVGGQVTAGNVAVNPKSKPARPSGNSGAEPEEDEDTRQRR